MLSPPYKGVGEPRTIGPIIKALREDPYYGVRHRAVNVLVFYEDPQVLKPLIEALKDKHEVVRCSAASELGTFCFMLNIKDPAAVVALISALRDSDDTVRSGSASALKHYRDPIAAKPLIQCLGDRSKDVRNAVADSLGEIGDSRAIEVLFPLLRDEIEQVRTSAAASLKKLGVSEERIKQESIGARETFNRLVKELSQSSTFSPDYSLQWRAIELARQLNPPPTVSEEAKRFMAEGKVALKMAQKPEDFKEPAEKLQKAVNCAPWWPDAYFNLALVKEKLREYKDAIENLKLYLLATPNAPDAESVKSKTFELEYLHGRKEKAEGYVSAGHKDYESKKYEDAMASYKEAIRLDPGNEKAHAALGGALYKLNRYEEAIPELKEGIRLGDHSQFPFNILGLCYQRLGDLKKAITTFEEGAVYQLCPEYLNYNLGENYEKIGNCEKALKHFEEALRCGIPSADYVKGKINDLKRRLGR